MEPEIDYKGNLRHFHAALRIFVRQMNDMGGKMNCSISQPYTLDKLDNLPAHIVHVVFWLSDKLADRSIYLDASEYAPDRTKIYPAVSWLDNKDGKSWERNEPLFEIIRAYFSDKETKNPFNDELTEQSSLSDKTPGHPVSPEIIRKFHQLVKTTTLSANQIQQKLGTDTRSYYQHCKAYTGEDAVDMSERAKLIKNGCWPVTE